MTSAGNANVVICDVAESPPETRCSRTGARVCAGVAGFRVASICPRVGRCTSTGRARIADPRAKACSAPGRFAPCPRFEIAPQGGSPATRRAVLWRGPGDSTSYSRRKLGALYIGARSRRVAAPETSRRPVREPSFGAPGAPLEGARANSARETQDSKTSYTRSPQAVVQPQSHCRRVPLNGRSALERLFLVAWSHFTHSLLPTATVGRVARFTAAAPHP